MYNYRRYAPYRARHRRGLRPVQLVGWGIILVVLMILVRNGFGSKSRDANSDQGNEVTTRQAGSNANADTLIPTPVLGGRELTTADCTRAVSLGSSGQPYVALTLDGGQVVGQAAHVLDVLRQQQVPGTIFVTGKWVEEHGDVVKAYADAGVDVFSHSYSHARFPGLTTDQIDTELSKADAAITAVTGRPTKPYFRPPFGDLDAASLAEVRKQGDCAITWTVDANDWKDGATVDEARNRVLGALRNDAIILVQANSDIAVALIPSLVEAVRGKGYSFVSLRDLLRRPADSSTSTTNRGTNTKTSTTNGAVKVNGNVNRTTNVNASNTNSR